ncbi:MAG TPA: HDIG domain-containing protein [Thermoflexales bacterium]|nr:HDIG domain-containing protein [Thermoflexales bacterium]HQW34628.1 HDIG domain-containing protein [Thermoflexales bacterium]HQZ23479.1 HDIG domain-containing protein [Thermoflexales bacterium]HQZ99345.1 HDIG domain-containing protein [Thermoflexales bacterium]
MHTQNRRTLALVAIAALTFAGLVTAQLSRAILTGGQTLSAGAVAPRDIRAPRHLSFVSDVETNRQRDLAQAAVAPIYTPPDAQIARGQLAAAREALDKVAQTRAALLTRKEISATDAISQITGLPTLGLTPDTAHVILKLSDLRWAQIDAGAVALVDGMMRGPIQKDNADSMKARLPAQISLSYTPEEAALMAALASPWIVPNTNFDAAATDAARRAARNAVRPVERTFEANQIIVRSGQVLGAADIETLDKFNLRQPALTPGTLAAAFAWSGLAVALFFLAALLPYTRKSLTAVPIRRVFLSAGLLALAIFLGRWLLPGHGLLPYLAPFAAVAICISIWSGLAAGLTGAVVMGLMIGITLEPPLEFVSVIAGSSIAAVLIIRRAEHVSDFVRAGMVAMLAGMGLVIAFHISAMNSEDMPQMGVWLLGVMGGNLAAAALAPVILYLTGLAFDIVTVVQLMELARPSHPLIQEMLLRAPGTYHHSLMVASLAEQAADKLGADALLVRVGAYYHDIGKTLHPYFFIENQTENNNVHDQLDPLTSSHVLHNHVSDGLEIARKHRLPTRIKDFIAEHHGTTVTKFPLVRARQAQGDDLDDAPFRYPGPRPRSRETAILMLADGCEAIVRARHPKEIEETDALVRKIIADRLADHQLDDCDLTLRDIETIRQSFLDTLRGLYHPRLDYPEVNAAAAAPALEPAQELSVTGMRQSTPESARLVTDTSGQGFRE